MRKIDKATIWTSSISDRVCTEFFDFSMSLSSSIENKSTGSLQCCPMLIFQFLGILQFLPFCRFRRYPLESDTLLVFAKLRTADRESLHYEFSILSDVLIFMGGFKA